MSSVADLIVAEAEAQGVDPSLAIEVATEESSLNQNARGSSGEIGVFQLMPDTAAALGVDPTDLNQNIHGGVMYLGQMLAQFGDPVMAVAAYNAGPGAVSKAVAKYGTDGFVIAAPGGPCMPSWLAALTAGTQNYVLKILGNLCTQYSAIPSIPGVSPTSTLPPSLQPGYGTPGQPVPADDTMYLVFAAVGLLSLVLYANS